jgi:hypothetical protein
MMHFMLLNLDLTACMKSGLCDPASDGGLSSGRGCADELPADDMEAAIEYLVE